MIVIYRPPSLKKGDIGTLEFGSLPPLRQKSIGLEDILVAARKDQSRAREKTGVSLDLLLAGVQTVAAGSVVIKEKNFFTFRGEFLKIPGKTLPGE